MFFLPNMDDGGKIIFVRKNENDYTIPAQPFSSLVFRFFR